MIKVEPLALVWCGATPKWTQSWSGGSGVQLEQTQMDSDFWIKDTNS